MPAVFKNECGTGGCSCTFLLLDFELAREWCTSFKQFLEAAKASLTGMKVKTLLMPCKLTSLAEHEQCFQQWCILQLLLGVLAALTYLLLAIIWNATSDSQVEVSVSSIIMDACVRLVMALLATWLVWFAVVLKKGCCCALLCCCVGKPNILAVAILEGIIALLTALTVMQSLGHGHILLILAALVTGIHLVSQVYFTMEASMVWWKSLDAANATKETTVGPPVILGAGTEKNAEAKRTEATVEASADV